MQPVLKTVYNPDERREIINDRAIVCCRMCPRLRVLTCQDNKFQSDFCGIQKAVINEPDFSWCSFGFIEMWSEIHKGKDGVTLMKQFNEDIFTTEQRILQQSIGDRFYFEHRKMPPVGKELEPEYRRTNAQG